MLNNIAAIMGGGAAAVGDYESIATTTVGAGGSATVTFSSIPSTYKHLQIRTLARDSRAVGNLSNMYISFNSDSGSNYARHELTGDGSSAGAGSATSQTSIYFGNCGSANIAANIFATTILDVLDYSNTNKYKTTRTLSGGDYNGGGVIALNSGLWMNTAAISTITITPLVANFVQYSSFALYGIK